MCTPLHLAAAKGHSNVIQSLLAASANVNCQDEVSNSFNVCDIVHDNVMIVE